MEELIQCGQCAGRTQASEEMACEWESGEEEEEGEV
jgi:hypothetical protein